MAELQLLELPSGEFEFKAPNVEKPLLVCEGFSECF